MCGIAGVIGNVENAGEQLQLISHRGPDDSGTFQDGSLWFGHCRLSILDLSENGHQPMVSSDGRFVLIYNGEIYNHWDLRKDLEAKGHKFKSTTDTETVLYGFLEYGREFFAKMNGIFALSIYDRYRNEVILARDHFGVKPLYYYFHGGNFMFASEMKFFTGFSFFRSELNTDVFYSYLQMLYATGENTLYKYVKKLRQGTCLTYSLNNGALLKERFFDLDYSAEEKFDGDIGRWESLLEQHLISAIERQLLSDVPIGFFLSGGLDSSLIVSLASRIKGSSDPMKCFTIDTGSEMKREGFPDDLFYARRLAGQMNLELHVIPSEIGFEENFDRMVWHLDEPQADPAAMHILNICTAAREQNIKVLLGGTAGDDLFSGYRRHQALRMENFLRFIPRSAGQALGQLTSLGRFDYPFLRRLAKLFESSGKTKFQRMAGYHCWIPTLEIIPLLRTGFIDKNCLPEYFLTEMLNKLPAEVSDLNKMLYLEMNAFLPDHNLNYTDKISMAVGVETRVPFLDVELFKLSAIMPSCLKMKGVNTKFLLKRVAEKYLPKELVYRPKTGFGAPVRTWVKRDMRSFVHSRLFDSCVLYRDFFVKSEVEKLVKRNEIGKIDASFTILTLVAIESWLRQFYYQRINDRVDAK